MKREAKHSAAGRAVTIESIKLIANHPAIFFRAMVLANKNTNIVYAQFVRHDDHSATFDTHRHRLFVAAPVADVFEAFSREMVRCVKALAQSWSEPALGRLPCGCGNDLFDFANDTALFFDRVIDHRDAVGHAVAEPFPLPLVALLDDRWVMLANFGIEKHARPD